MKVGYVQVLMARPVRRLVFLKAVLYSPKYLCVSAWIASQYTAKFDRYVTDLNWLHDLVIVFIFWVMWERLKQIINKNKIYFY